MEADLKKAFEKLDKNGDRSLTKKEIRDVLKQHDETFDDSDEEMFDEIDANNDNKVSYQGKSYFCHFWIYVKFSQIRYLTIAEYLNKYLEKKSKK